MSNTYFYHPDHLGSTSLVTNSYGEITQNISYIPYGEIFVEETAGGWQSPYYFNAKELDEETGLYYYGARFLDPAGARWISVDPLFEKYMGMSPYNYCAGNPVNIIDMNGDSCAVLFAPDGAWPAGHMAILIQGEDKKWYLFSKNGTDENAGIYGEQRTSDNSENGKLADQNGVGPFDSVKHFLQNGIYNRYEKENGHNEYTEALIIPLTKDQDKLAREGAKKELKNKYNLLGSNCAKTVQSALKNAKVYDGSDIAKSCAKNLPYGPLSIYKTITEEKTPAFIYDRLKEYYNERNGGKVIKTEIHKK